MNHNQLIDDINDVMNILDEKIVFMMNCDYHNIYKFRECFSDEYTIILKIIRE